MKYLLSIKRIRLRVTYALSFGHDEINFGPNSFGRVNLKHCWPTYLHESSVIFPDGFTVGRKVEWRSKFNVIRKYAGWKTWLNNKGFLWIHKVSKQLEPMWLSSYLNTEAKTWSHFHHFRSNYLCEAAREALIPDMRHTFTFTLIDFCVAIASVSQQLVFASLYRPDQLLRL